MDLVFDELERIIHTILAETKVGDHVMIDNFNCSLIVNSIIVDDIDILVAILSLPIIGSERIATRISISSIVLLCCLLVIRNWNDLQTLKMHFKKNPRIFSELVEHLPKI